MAWITPILNWVASNVVLPADLNRIEGNTKHLNDNKEEKSVVDALTNNKVDKISGKGLSTEDYTTVEKDKLSKIQSGAQVNAVTSVAGKTGAVSVTKADVGLGSVENYEIATQAEAETGTSNLKYMTPLRTKESAVAVVAETAFQTASFISFATNANKNSLDAAFGKGNPTDIKHIGKQLAMYAWFSGEDKTVNPYTNLIQKQTLVECATDELAIDEMSASSYITALLKLSPYAQSVFSEFYFTATRLAEWCSSPTLAVEKKSLVQSFREAIVTTLNNSPTVFSKQPSVNYLSANSGASLKSALLNTNTILIPILSPDHYIGETDPSGLSTTRTLYYGEDSSYSIWSATITLDLALPISSGVSMRGIYYKQSNSATSIDPNVTCDVYTVI